MALIRLPAWSYRQFDADYSLDVPGEGYGGWQRVEIEIDPARTALVVMHAWDCGTRTEFPGWYRCVEYIPRANAIAGTVLPPLLAAARRSPITLLHVVEQGTPARDYPGYRRAVALAGAQARAEAAPASESAVPDPSWERLRNFRSDNVFVGAHNRADVAAGFARLDIHPAARPVGDEGVAEHAAQLSALCRDAGVNHLVYAGFAINGCLLTSPGGMVDMSRRGFICSALRQAVTAIENRESARTEMHKEEALWRVALLYGFVFDVDDFAAAIGNGGSRATG